MTATDRPPLISHPLAAGIARLTEAVALCARSPLSARHAVRAAVASDQLADLAFAQRGALAHPALARAQDLPAFRAALRDAEPSLAVLMDLTLCAPEGPRLQIEAMPVAPDEFPQLAVSELMVSLYNAGTVPRLMLVHPPREAQPVLALLQTASRWWAALD